MILTTVLNNQNKTFEIIFSARVETAAHPRHCLLA